MTKDDILKALRDGLVGSDNKLTPHQKRVLDSKMENARFIADSAGELGRSKIRDAKDAIFLKHMVLQTMAAIERHSYPRAKWSNSELIQIRSEIDPGADTYGWYESAPVTKGAKLMSSDADDFPLVDLRGDFNTEVAHSYGAAYKYTTQDVRKGRLHGMFDLIQEKSSRTSEALDRLLNDLVAFGDTGAKFKGVFNVPGAIAINAELADYANNPQNLINDLAQARTVQGSETELVEEFDTVTMPYALWVAITTQTHDSGVDTTIFNFLQAAFQNVTKWDWTKENETGGDDGGPCILAYDRSPEKIRAEQPMVPTPLPVEAVGRTFIHNFEGRYGGLVAKRPRSMVKLNRLGL